MSLTNEEKITVLKELTQAGGKLAVEIPSIGGFRTFFISPTQAAKLISQEKQAVYGELLGLSRDEYVEWYHSQGSVYCSGHTKSGTRCRNTIIGATSLQPPAWLKQREEGGYCSTHGGCSKHTKYPKG